MRIIIGCEESGTIRDAFAERGHEAWSCDLKKARNGGPHLQGNIFDFLGPCRANNFKHWDLFICHPPCTYLTLTANKWLKDQPPRKSGALVGEERRQAQREAIKFTERLWSYPIKKKCFENPMGVLSTKSILGKPSQIIHPYYFGDEARKLTCLWLEGLPKLVHQKEVDLFSSDVTHVGQGKLMVMKSGKVMPDWYANADRSEGQEKRAEIRSKTFDGIAQAMATQWDF